MDSPINKSLLDILVCPETKQRLALLSQTDVDVLNKKILASTLKNRLGNVLKDPIDGALKREDGAYAYPIRAGIPVMLVDEGIPLSK